MKPLPTLILLEYLNRLTPLEYHSEMWGLPTYVFVGLRSTCALRARPVFSGAVGPLYQGLPEFCTEGNAWLG